jgi:hypothetical protein
MRRHVRNKNNNVEKKKDRNPNVDTATSPRLNIGGSGDNVWGSTVTIMAKQT